MSPDGATILVVDDNEDNLYTLTQRLRREGYTNVATARDGRQALELLRTRPFDRSTVPSTIASTLRACAISGSGCRAPL